MAAPAEAAKAALSGQAGTENTAFAAGKGGAVVEQGGKGDGGKGDQGVGGFVHGGLLGWLGAEGGCGGIFAGTAGAGMMLNRFSGSLKGGNGFSGCLRFRRYACAAGQAARAAARGFAPAAPG